MILGSGSMTAKMKPLLKPHKHMVKMRIKKKDCVRTPALMYLI